ncbi:MAG TPA: aminotransferase class V-fold PLP-dependent enzyme [Phycisphaerae bacterium]|jgi:glutamate/tyrosine decarboxylase-like PLP-dependent enzyme
MMPLDFDPDPDEFVRWAATTANLIAERLRAPGDGPVFHPAPPELSESIETSVWPDEPQPAVQLLDEITRLIWPYPMGNNHPRFFGWVNTPSAPIAIVGEMLAAAMNPSVAGGGHAATYVEHHLLKWFRDLFAFPRGSAGLLVSGGSMATLTALTVARHVKAGWNVREEGLQSTGRAPLVLYMSNQGHSCITKSAELLGLGRKFVRLIETDRDDRLDVAQLAQRVEEDRAAGLHPFCVVASAGTVGTGAIDPLDAIADLCARESLWFHVDGAIGAVAILLDEFRDVLRGLERADSLAFDPHKWLYVPVECGAVLVRDGAALRDAFSLVPAYLRTQRDPTGGPPWFSEFGFQQSRGFRALKLWMALRYYGRNGYRAMLRHCVAQADLLRQKISAHPDLELCSAGGSTVISRLPIVPFRYRPAVSAMDDERLDRLNEAIMQAIQQRGKVFVTQARLGARFALRASLLNYRTQSADIDTLIDEACQVGADLASSP